ncbi:MAG: MBOAT family O-acyltransferase [Tissierellia bacterium]|nr:MBOAT family O-acyltransferase [Tissierellia bacterium]
MPFNTMIFLFVFFPIFIFIYTILPYKYKGIFLTMASILFYQYSSSNAAVKFLVFLFILYIYTYLYVKSGYNKIIFAIGIAGLVIYLVYYKYSDFLISELNNLLNLNLIIKDYKMAPLGISFYTFSSISFLTEIKRKKMEMPNLLGFLNYMTFFPKIVSGPIARPESFIYEGMNLKRANEAISRFIIGLSKKVILAHYLGQAADFAWNNLAMGIDIPTAWIGALAYSLQLYFDFSGYSDMAIALGNIMGYSLPENFNFPYMSKSITEFWKRWHISLGSWFKDYIYIPLGGSRKGNVYLNLFIVFLLTGIWHGASKAFILWGIWHGFIRILEKFFWEKRWYKEMSDSIKWIFTILVVLFGWVFFRSSGIREGILFLKRMFGFAKPDKIIYSWRYLLNYRLLFYLIIGIFFSTIFEKTKIPEKWKSAEDNPSLHFAKTIILSILMIINIMMMISSDFAPFLYFRF